MNAVILAAGDGGRLLPHTASLPKPLLPVRGRPLIQYVIDALHEAGVTDTTVVAGYRAEQVRRAVLAMRPGAMTLRFVQNDAYMRGNARSLWAVRGTQRAPFVLAMADHIIEPGIVRRVAQGDSQRCRLAVERVRGDDARADEATRALVHRDRVEALGKEIERWNALDTGVFWCTPAIFDAITPELRDGEAGAVFAQLAARGDLDAVDVTGLHWADVDTPGDLRAAEGIGASIHDGAHARIA